ncbi:MAG: hypothetical protein FJW69_05940 [Actinobacteria bacterium]|nr:hypothetical protein [Actinomycetota bacterium]MBM3712920.1 hypothetical protein [Actinomycetota bacterium]
MNNLEKYLKIARKVVIKPGDEDIENKIINRLSNIGEEDKSLLDESFLDYLKKNNSRIYLFSENVKNNPGKYALMAVVSIAFIGLIFLIIKSIYYKDYSSSNAKNLKGISTRLSSSKNKN